MNVHCIRYRLYDIRTYDMVTQGIVNSYNILEYSMCSTMPYVNVRRCMSDMWYRMSRRKARLGSANAPRSFPKIWEHGLSFSYGRSHLWQLRSLLRPQMPDMARPHATAMASSSGILTTWYPDIYRHIPSYDGIEWSMEVCDGYIRIMPPSIFHTWG